LDRTTKIKKIFKVKKNKKWNNLKKRINNIDIKIYKYIYILYLKMILSIKQILFVVGQLIFLDKIFYYYRNSLLNPEPR
jgi:hypothetical protein